MNWVDMTDTAYEKVVGFLQGVEQPERQAMWLEATGTSGNRWNCSLSLKPLDAAAPRDIVLRHRDLPIVIRARDFRKSAEPRSTGSTIRCARAACASTTPTHPVLLSAGHRPPT